MQFRYLCRLMRAVLCTGLLIFSALNSLPLRADSTPPPPQGDPAGADLSGPLYSPNSYLSGWGTGTSDAKGQWQAYKDPAAPTVQELSKNVSKAFYSMNFAWVLVAGFLVMFMQAGFALVETGLVRAKNVSHTLGMNLFVYAIGMLGFFVSGFALMCGGVNGTAIGGPGALGGIPVLNKMFTVPVGGTEWGIFGQTGFALTGASYDAAAIVWFLFMMVFMDTTATIPTGTLAERWKFWSFVIFSFFIGALIYPVFGCWVWGGGWLAQLGLGAGLGHGAVDFAGSGVVHLQGGLIALVLAKMIGPRLGKFGKDGKPNTIHGHNNTMVVLGTFILAFGWFGFNAGSTLAATDARIGVVAVNTMLASATGLLVAALCAHSRTKRFDLVMMCNGMLAGLVAVTAACAFVAPWAACLIGAFGGFLMFYGSEFVEKVFKIDDPVGAIAVHGLCGAFGIIALGLFADGTYGAGWNGVGYSEYLGVAGKGVTGLFYGDSSQLVAQLITVGAAVLWNVPVCALIFWLVGKLVKGNRVPADHETLGLDASEMNGPAFPEDAFGENLTTAAKVKALSPLSS